MDKFKIDRFTIELVTADGAERVCYMPMPFEVEALQPLADEFKMNFVVISGMDWDNDLTPWPAPNVPAHQPPFAGNACAFRRVLREEILPQAEERLGMRAPRRILAGVSLSGLFALWTWVQTTAFHDMISISGSFWYPGFVDWLRRQPIADVLNKGTAYFSLGVEEPHTRVKEFRSVGKDTEEVVSYLKLHDIRTLFQWNPGNHFADPVPRLRRALEALEL